MKIEIVNVGQTITELTKTNKPYKVFELIYKNHDFEGKVETRKVNDYSQAVFGLLAKAKQGEFYDIVREKNAGGFWNWNSIAAGTAVMDAPKQPAEEATPYAGKKVVGSTYETADERAENRSKIVRQSSIGYAILTIKTDKSPANIDDVLKIAQIYFDWVYQAKTPIQELIDMEDDIPQ